MTDSHLNTLLEKGADFFACVRLGNIKGLKDAVHECKPVVAEIKAAGHDFNALCKSIEERTGIPFSMDAFLEAVKDLFESSN